MKSRFRYAWLDLGEQQEGSTVVVRLRGPANVLLLDPKNFAAYRSGYSFAYVGGHYRRSQVQLAVPRDGHWYVVLDLGGRPGSARGAVSVLAPGESAPDERALAGASSG